VTVVNRYAGNSLRGRVAIYVVGSTSLVLFVAAQSVLDAERGAKGGNISNFGEALWWAMTAVSTVGYGDRFPVTEAGRFIAGGLMLAGIALLGVVTASLESWLIERVIEVEEDAQAAVRRAVLDLTREVAALRDELRQGREQSRGRGID
jgi:voltage-gated potassium channel